MEISEIILAFIVAVVLVYLVFWFYRYYQRRTVVHRQSEIMIEGQHDATKYAIVDRRKIPLSVQGNEYTISFWIFIKDFNYRYGSNKTILYRGDKANTESNPFIYLQPKNNDMTIKVQLQTDTIDQNLKDMEQRALVQAPSNQNNAPEADASLVGTPAPLMEQEPIRGETMEEFRVSMPIGYFRNKSGQDKSKYSNISGNEIEDFEDVSEEATGPTVPAGDEASQPETLTGLDNRLDKVELQVSKLMGMKEDSSVKEEAQGQMEGQEVEMPIVYDECVVRNLPLQKWTHVAVSIFNNHTEVYLDGKLHKACSLKGFPKPSVQHLHVCANGGFDGYLANIEYSNMAITAEEVYQDYIQGPKLTRGLGDKMGDLWNGFTSVFKE